MPSVVSIATGRGPRPRRQGEYLLVELALPDAPRCNIGVLLRDAETGAVYPKMRSHFTGIADLEETELLEALPQDFEDKIREMGGDGFLRYLEDSLSNTLRLTERTAIAVDDFPRTLDWLYEEHVEAEKPVSLNPVPADVRPFVTHLPLYSLRAAATRFGADMEVEAEDWVPGPARLPLTPDMFVARVVGRSMEPRIPDGSLCVFRYGVVGSRQGKLLLVERFGITETSAQYTIKKYTSKKVESADEQWEHASVRLDPLNPEFEGFELKEGEARVIAEFIQVLE